jgi:peptidoglycan hydrolase-like protein with peptidoglycan-binding domain
LLDAAAEVAMSVGLRDLLELPEAKEAATSEQVEELRQQFTERMAELNSSLQLMAGQASKKDFQSLDSQRLKLYEAFQKTSALVDKGDPSTGKESVKRMLAALEAIQAKAADAASGVTAGHDEWLAREDEFDDLVVRIGELEEAGDPKAATLRKLADSIRSRANECDYQQSVSALDQLRPKFDQIYGQYQQAADSPPGASEVPAAGKSKGKGDELGGVFPEIVGEQLQSELKETESIIAQLEEAKVANASKYRHSFIKIRELAQTKAIMEAAAAHNRLREFVDADMAKLNKSRLGGVKLPEEYAQKNTKYSTGVEIPKSSQPSKGAGYPREVQPDPEQPPQYQDATKPTGGDYKDQPSPPKSAKAGGGATLKQGSKGPEVSQLQQQLGLNPDGDFGPKTAAAVRAFQGSHGLTADGVVGPKTWAALGSGYAPPAPQQAYPPQPPKKQPPKQGPYPPQPPKEKPAYPPQPPKKGPAYPPQPPEQYKGTNPGQPPGQYKGEYPAEPPEQYKEKYPAEPPGGYEPLQMEQYGGGQPPQDDYASQQGYTEVETRGSAEDPLAADYFPEGLPDAEGQGGSEPPPPTERPDPPDSGGPPTDRPPPPTERPDRPADGGPPTERRPIQMEEYGNSSQGESIEMEGMAEEPSSGLPSFGIEPGSLLNDSSRPVPPGRDDPLVGQNKAVDPKDKTAGIKGTFDELLGKLGITGVFSDVPHGEGDPAEYNPDSPTKSGKTRYGHLRPKDGPLEGNPPPPVVPIPPEKPAPPPLRTWGAPDPQPGDPNFIGPPAPPVTNSLSQAADGIEDVAERLFGEG